MRYKPGSRLAFLLAVSMFASTAWSQPSEPPPPPADPPPADPPPADPPPVEPTPPPTEPTPPPPAQIGVITGIVQAPDLEAPLAGAIVTVIGTGGISAITDEAGRYRLEVPLGPQTLRVEVGGFRVLERAVTVAAGENPALDFAMVPDQQLSEVVVIVGSRTPRTKLETTAPVDVLTAQDIARSGRTETGRVLGTLVPSYISTPQSIADGSDHIDPASLRGLGPDQVLVLINGKRRHRTALMHVNGTFGRGTVGTDLNAIPASSIKRIEVLRDGAASQYGSDAIAGVINIVTKDVTDLVEVSALSGITGSGDGMQVKTGANYGWKIGDKGFVNITGEFLRRDATSRSGVYTDTVYNNDRAIDDQILAEKGLTRDDFKMKIGESAAVAGLGAYNLELPFGDHSKFYSFGDLSYRRGLSAGFYRFPKQVSQNVPEFYPDGFLPEIATKMSDRAITVGLKRKGTWDVDVSLTHGENTMGFEIENTVNASLGTSSPTTFDAGTLHFAQTVGNLDVVRKIDTKLVKSLSLVLGSELRVENYQIGAGEEASYSLGPETFGTPPVPKAAGAQVFPGFQPSNEVDRSRDSVGVYAGIESQIRKELTLDLGGRFEQYSDFGNSLIGKAAARYEVAKGIAVRGAVSTGFRAPSLQQLWFSNISTLFLPDAMGVLQPTQVLTSNNASPVTRAFGIPKLNEEKAISGSGGVTVRPNENFSVTADAYLIAISDRIVLTSQFANSNPVVAEILAPFPGVSQAQFFANAVDTSTKGLDIVIDYGLDLGGGAKLNLTGSANFTSTRVKDVKIPTSLSDRFADKTQLRTFYFGRQAENRLEDSVPLQKGTASARLAYRKLNAMVRANYFGKVVFKPDNPVNDETFGAKVLLDAEVGYQLTKNLNVLAGADNLLNTFPEQQDKEANRSFGRFVYSRNVSQFGQNGGFYYLKLEMTFF